MVLVVVVVLVVLHPSSVSSVGRRDRQADGQMASSIRNSNPEKSEKEEGE